MYKNNKKDDIPTPPFVSYRVFSDGILRMGLVKSVYFFEDVTSLVGTPSIEYDMTHPINDPSERCSVPYLVDINFTPKEAWESYQYELNRRSDVYQGGLDKLIENFKYRIIRDTKILEDIKEKKAQVQIELDKL